MQNKINLKQILLLIGILCEFSVYSQFNQYNAGPWFGQTNGFPFNTTAIGIGSFQPATPQSRLHVNNFLLGNPGGPLNGL